MSVLNNTPKDMTMKRLLTLPTGRVVAQVFNRHSNYWTDIEELDDEAAAERKYGIKARLFDPFNLPPL